MADLDLTRRLEDLYRNGPTSSWRDDVRDGVAELRRLLQWQAEASHVIKMWERVWAALGCPGELGQSLAAASVLEVERLRAAADRIDQLEQQLADLHTAIGDPNELRRAAVSVGRDRKVTNAEAERRILALTRLAAAVEHTQEGTDG